jgi:putative transposase
MFKMHPGARAEPVLAAWGITTTGAPVFVALAAGGSESTDAWAGFLDELTARGLRPPLLVISDGAAGLLAAVETTLPRSLRQRCLIHRSRNVLAKVPAEAQGEIRDAYWAIFDTDILTATAMTPGHALVAAVQGRIDTFAEKYASVFPSAVKCLLTDREQLTSYLRFPLEHHRRIRHSNFIERTFGETRRRVKVIGRLPRETSCLNLVWAVLDRASRGWRGMNMTATGTRLLLADLRRQLLDPPTPIRRPEMTTQTAPPETVGAVA